MGNFMKDEMLEKRMRDPQSLRLLPEVPNLESSEYALLHVRRNQIGKHDEWRAEL